MAIELPVVDAPSPTAALRYWRSFLVAFVLVAGAAALRIWPLHGLGSNLPWLTFYPVVMLAAICSGAAAALLASLLACVAVAFLWPLVVAQPFLRTPFDYVDMAVFALSGFFFSALARCLRRAEAGRQQAESAALASAGSERFLKSILDAMPDMIGYWDRDLRCRFANQAYHGWFGKLPSELVGTRMQDLTGERLFALNEPHIRGVLAGEPQRFQRALSKVDGRTGYIVGNYIPDIGAAGAVQGFFILGRDVTELKEAQAQLELAASVFENTVEGIVVTDTHGVILSVNPAFSEITGYTAEEAVGQTPRILKSNRHDQAFYRAIWQSIASDGRWKGDIWNRRKNGDVYLERITISMIRNESGDPVRYVSVFSDITDLWRKDEYLKHLAFHDALTDLPNRFLLMERLEHQVAIAEREHFGLAVIFLDLDGFKFVNDHFGHEVGDDLLRVVAQRLLLLVRQSDTVARLGGDEFVITLSNPANRDEVAQVAHRIVEAINVPMEFRGEVLQVGTSLGIAIYPADGRNPADLLKNADVAMYAAKDGGKNTFRFFEPAMALHPEATRSP